MKTAHSFLLPTTFSFVALFALALPQHALCKDDPKANAQALMAEAKKAGSLAVIKLAEKYWVRSVGVIHRSDKNLSLAAKKFLPASRYPSMRARAGIPAMRRKC